MTEKDNILHFPRHRASRGLPRYAVRQPHTLGIYIHVPWCIKKCDYCDFYSVALNPKADGTSEVSRFSVEADETESYFRALETELQVRLPHFGGKLVDSIYFGGGTPSLLEPEMLRRILELLRENFDVSLEAEISLEANPENLSREYVTALAELGFNRLNVGFQTKNKKFLDSMNRYHKPGRYSKAVRELKEYDFPAIGADLIYGFAGQTSAKFYEDLEPLLDLRFEHISLYALTPEPGTPYYNAIKSGKARPPAEKVQRQVFMRASQFMGEQGYNYYEISNFALPGHECRSNLRYWLYEPYLGLGPGAHGFTGEERYGNPRHLERWLKSPAGASLQPGKHLTDFLLGYLRLVRGLHIPTLSETLQEYGYPKARAEIFEGVFEAWQEDGILHEDGEDCYAWDIMGLAYHNDRVLELIEFLEEHLT